MRRRARWQSGRILSQIRAGLFEKGVEEFLVLGGPDAEGAGFAGGDDEGAVGSGGGGEDGVVDAGEVLVVGFEVPGGGGEELIAVAEEGDGGKLGGEAALGFRFLSGVGIPEFVEAVGSGGGEGGGVGAPGKGCNTDVMGRKNENWFD